MSIDFNGLNLDDLDNTNKRNSQRRSSHDILDEVNTPPLPSKKSTSNHFQNYDRKKKDKYYGNANNGNTRRRNNAISNNNTTSNNNSNDDKRRSSSSFLSQRSGNRITGIHKKGSPIKPGSSLGAAQGELCCNPISNHYQPRRGGRQLNFGHSQKMTSQASTTSKRQKQRQERIYNSISSLETIATKNHNPATSTGNNNNNNNKSKVTTTTTTTTTTLKQSLNECANEFKNDQGFTCHETDDVIKVKGQEPKFRISKHNHYNHTNQSHSNYSSHSNQKQYHDKSTTTTTRKRAQEVVTIDSSDDDHDDDDNNNNDNIGNNNNNDKDNNYNYAVVHDKQNEHDTTGNSAINDYITSTITNNHDTKSINDVITTSPGHRPTSSVDSIKKHAHKVQKKIHQQKQTQNECNHEGQKQIDEHHHYSSLHKGKDNFTESTTMKRTSTSKFAIFTDSEDEEEERDTSLSLDTQPNNDNDDNENNYQQHQKMTSSVLSPKNNYNKNVNIFVNDDTTNFEEDDDDDDDNDHEVIDKSFSSPILSCAKEHCNHHVNHSNEKQKNNNSTKSLLNNENIRNKKLGRNSKLFGNDDDVIDDDAYNDHDESDIDIYSALAKINKEPYRNMKKRKVEEVDESEFDISRNIHHEKDGSNDNVHYLQMQVRRTTPLNELGTPPPSTSPPQTTKCTSLSPLDKAKQFVSSGLDRIGKWVGREKLQGNKNNKFSVRKVNNDTNDDIESVQSNSQNSQSTLFNKSKKRKKGSYDNDDDYQPPQTPTNRLRNKRKTFTMNDYVSSGSTSPYSSYSCHPKQRLTRSSSKKRNRGDGEIINLCDDDDADSNESEFENVEINDMDIAMYESLKEEKEHEKTKLGGKFFKKVKRIAIGNKVFTEACHLLCQSGSAHQYIELKYIGSDSDRRVHKIRLLQDSVSELKFFILSEKSDKTEMERFAVSDENDEKKTFVSTVHKNNSNTEEDSRSIQNILALIVVPDDENGLASLPNRYVPDGKDQLKKYISIEFNNSNDLESLILERLFKIPFLDKWITENNLSSKDREEEREDIIKAFIKEDRRQLRSRRGKSYLRSVKPDDVLLNFPFEATYEELDKAAEKLTEANGLLTTSEEKIDNCTKKHEMFHNVWKHSHIVRGEDYERLKPGEYLNDVLIDFWMTWILRKDESSSDVHFFSTQFFQKIQDQGVESVQNWTKRRKINVFEKKFIFIPINDHLHWSLCVVVNPGTIEHAYHSPEEMANEMTCDAPFLLFFDSLKFHEQKKVKDNIYAWLNFEAKQMDKFQNLRNGQPFWAKSLPMVTPKIPYQDNGWDCGVFVCRYAFSMLYMRSEQFQYKLSPRKNYHEAQKNLQMKWNKMISDSGAFNFDVDDIARLRKEFATLIDNLSDMYKAKEQERTFRRLEAKKERNIGKETSNQGGCNV